MKSVLIVGIDSLIGGNISAIAAQDNMTVLGTSRRSKSDVLKCELSNDDDIASLPKCDLAYLCVGETNISKCQQDPVGTHYINVGQSIKVAQHLHNVGASIVYLSTSLVFDGNGPFPDVSDSCSAITEYGKQKVETESALLNTLDRIAVVRLTKVVHSRFPLFLSWYNTLKSGQKITPFSDMNFCPLSIEYVAAELWELSSSFNRGIYQLSSDAEISYSDAARLLGNAGQFDQSLITPITTSEAGFKQYFPQHPSLQNRPVRPGNPVSSVQTLEKLFYLLSSGF